MARSTIFRYSQLKRLCQKTWDSQLNSFFLPQKSPQSVHQKGLPLGPSRQLRWGGPFVFLVRKNGPFRMTGKKTGKNGNFGFAISWADWIWGIWMNLDFKVAVVGESFWMWFRPCGSWVKNRSFGQPKRRRKNRRLEDWSAQTYQWYIYGAMAPWFTAKSRFKQ